MTKNTNASKSKSKGKTSSKKKSKTAAKAKPAPKTAAKPAAPAAPDLPKGTLKEGDKRIPKNGIGWYFASPASIKLNDDILLRGPESPKNERFEALCKSVKKWGILEPIICRRTKEGALELVMGRQRLAAAKKAKLKGIPYVLTSGNDGEMMMKAIDENVARVDMSVIQEAKALKRAMKVTGAKSSVKLAKIMGKTPRYTALHMELLELPEALQNILDKRKDGTVTIGKTHQLMRLAPRYRADFIKKMLNMSEKGFTAFIEAKVESGEAAWKGGKAKPRGKKGGKKGTKPVPASHSLTVTTKSGEKKSVDMLNAAKVQQYILQEEKALNSETKKKNPNPETVRYHEGRISAFLQTLMLSPKAKSLKEALSIFDKK